MATQLTIRGVPEKVAERLTRLARERGESVNSIVVQILKEAVDVRERRSKLERFITGTDQDLAEFSEVLAEQRVIDGELWG